MKAVTLAFLVSLSLGLSAAEVRLGDSFGAVKAVLGEPRGQVRTGSRQLLYFDRGEVELQTGAVSRVALLSGDEYSALETKRAAAAMRMREQQEARFGQLRDEGRRIMARRLADPVFQAATPTDQVGFWEDFSRRYPDVDCSAPLAVARQHRIAQIEASLVQEEQARRLAELEARAREAEAARVVYVQTWRHRPSYYRNFDDCGRPAATNWPVVEYHFNDSIYSALSSPIPLNVRSSLRNEPRDPPSNHSRAHEVRPTGLNCPSSRQDDSTGRTSADLHRRF